jgi:hypothetical protein
MAVVCGPSMDGFVWSLAPPYVPTVPGEDGWCVRDSFCELFKWARGSLEWSRFNVEAPVGKDVDRLAKHLGLTIFDTSRDWNELIKRSAHPGVAEFVFPAYGKAHTVYVPDVQWLLHHWPTPDGPPATTADRQLLRYGWPLGPEHLVRGPELDAVIVDERQPSRAV